MHLLCGGLWDVYHGPFGVFSSMLSVVSLRAGLGVACLHQFLMREARQTFRDQLLRAMGPYERCPSLLSVEGEGLQDCGVDCGKGNPPPTCQLHCGQLLRVDPCFLSTLGQSATSVPSSLSPSSSGWRPVSRRGVLASG